MGNPSSKKLSEEQRQQMNGPLCPFCVTSNIPGAQLCIKCGKPIASNAMDSMMKDADNTKKELQAMKAQMAILQANTSNLLKVVMRYTNELVIHAWNNEEGPIETATKMIDDNRS